MSWGLSYIIYYYIAQYFLRGLCAPCFPLPPPMEKDLHQKAWGKTYRGWAKYNKCRPLLLLLMGILLSWKLQKGARECPLNCSRLHPGVLMSCCALHTGSLYSERDFLSLCSERCALSHGHNSRFVRSTTQLKAGLRTQLHSKFTKLLAPFDLPFLFPPPPLNCRCFLSVFPFLLAPTFFFSSFPSICLAFPFSCLCWFSLPSTVLGHKILTTFLDPIF